MAERTITLPSGAVLTVRGMKVAEANRWASRSGEKQTPGQVFNELLKACTVKVEDPGPAYTEFSWDNALIGDRFFGLMQIRCASYKEPYSFKWQCDKSGEGGCGRPFDVSINIDKDGDLRYVDMSAEARATYRASNRFETSVAGTKVVFKLINGADEPKVQRLLEQNKDRQLSASIAARLVEVEGVEQNDWMRWLDNLDLDDFVTLKESIEQVDGGVDTEIDISCPHCGHVMFDVQLPFGRGFILPTARRR